MKELIYTDYLTGGGRIALDFKFYPDSMPLVTEASEPWGAVLLRPKNLASFVAGMFWIDAVAERYGVPPEELILPFIPGARQDRLNTSGDMLFTAKSVARMINDRTIPKVTVLDPHSEVSSGLIDRCHIVTAADCINPPAGKYAAVISPDAGAEKRAGLVAKKLGVPLIHAWKTRSVTDGSITGFGHEVIGVPHGSKVLVVDDICDGGRTFTGLAETIRNHDGDDLDLHLYVTHGIFSQGTTELRKHYSHIYCTDSIPDDRDLGVIRINVCEGLIQ